MMAKIALFLLAVMPFAFSAHADVANPLRSVWDKQTPPLPPTIKVLIVHDKPDALLLVKGKYKIYDPKTKTTLANTRFVGKAQLVKAIPGGMKWGEEFPDVFQLEIVPMASDTQILVNNVLYQGVIQIYDIGGTISIVNELPIEDYLKNVLANKYPQTLPEEALAALVIAERTNAYYFGQYPKTQFWSVDGSKEGYNGFISTDPNSPVQKAIRNTRYMVLSKTTLYEGIATPFAIQWDRPPTGLGITSKAVSSTISMSEVADMAKKGDHAAMILDKAFPRTTIQLLHFTER